MTGIKSVSDEGRSRPPRTTPVLRLAGCWPSAGDPGVCRAAQWSTFGQHRCRHWVVQLRRVVIPGYGSGLSSPKMTSVASTTDSPGLSLPIPARGPARRLRRQYPRDRAAACVIQRLGADERGPRRVSLGGGHDHAHPGCDGDRPLPGRSVPRRVCPSVVADPATVRAPEPVG
jgi:hypothetical protein